MELGFEGRVGAGRSGVLSASAIFLFFIFVFPIYSQSILQNGNFEAGGGSFDDWTISHSVSQSSYSGPTIASGGYKDPYYAQFNYEAEGNDTLSQEVATTVGTVYDISFSAEDGAGHNLGAELNFGGSSFDLQSAFETGPGQWASGWKDFTFDVTATELETDFSLVVAADLGSGFGIDDISIVPVPDFAGVVVGNTYQVSVDSPAGYTTVIQGSTNMVNWVNVYTNTAPYIFTDSISQYPRRFYRAAIMGQSNQ
jgi:hypothetical protein